MLLSGLRCLSQSCGDARKTMNRALVWLCAACLMLSSATSCARRPTRLRIEAVVTVHDNPGLGPIRVASDRGFVTSITQEPRWIGHRHIWPSSEQGREFHNEEKPLFIGGSPDAPFGKIRVSVSWTVFRFRNDTPVKAAVTFVKRDGTVLAKGEVPSGQTRQMRPPQWFARTASAGE